MQPLRSLSTFDLAGDGKVEPVDTRVVGWRVGSRWCYGPPPMVIEADVSPWPMSTSKVPSSSPMYEHTHTV